MERTIYEACNDLVLEFGKRPMSADEVLAQKIDHLVPVPFKSREELAADSEQDRKDGLFEGELVPRIDLRVLHYYATQCILQKYPHLVECFDESSMITFGLLVEKWVREFLVAKSDADKWTLRPGAAQCVSKAVNYRDSPSDI